jgi:hypothetical protein
VSALTFPGSVLEEAPLCTVEIILNALLELADQLCLVQLAVPAKHTHSNMYEYEHNNLGLYAEVEASSFSIGFQFPGNPALTGISTQSC